MVYFKALIDSAYLIMQIKINLFGYNVSLWNVLAYSFLAFVLLYIFFRFFK